MSFNLKHGWAAISARLALIIVGLAIATIIAVIAIIILASCDTRAQIAPDVLCCCTGTDGQTCCAQVLFCDSYVPGCDCY